MCQIRAYLAWTDTENVPKLCIIYEIFVSLWYLFTFRSTFYPFIYSIKFLLVSKNIIVVIHFKSCWNKWNNFLSPKKKKWNNFPIHNVRMYSYVLILKLAFPTDFFKHYFNKKNIITSCEFQLQQNLLSLLAYCHYIARARNHAAWDSMQSPTSFSAWMENQTPVVTLFFQISA